MELLECGYLEDQEGYGRTILSFILGKWVVRSREAKYKLRIVSSGGF
jgi:hypothetical protein